MGIFSKIGKGIKKVFKKIGRGIKKAFKAFGKFMGKIGRNDKCPCGSNKKFKKCCERSQRLLS